MERHTGGKISLVVKKTEEKTNGVFSRRFGLRRIIFSLLLRIVSYRIVSYRIVSYRIVLYRIVLYCFVLYCIVLKLSRRFWNILEHSSAFSIPTTLGRSPIQILSTDKQTLQCLHSCQYTSSIPDLVVFTVYVVCTHKRLKRLVFSCGATL